MVHPVSQPDAVDEAGRPAATTHIRVLGPLEVVTPQGELALGGLTQRAILGYLLLHLDQVVATSQLIGALWPENPPATARKVVQNAVSRLRRVLLPAKPVDLVGEESGVRIGTRVPGYMLTTTDARMDFVQFQSLAEEGRSAYATGSPETAATTWGKALSLWRGRALVDLSEVSARWPELRRLQNSRLDTLEDYCAAELVCGRHESVLGELQTAATAEPQRERLLILLMVALYRTGRPAEALSTFATARSEMIDKLGLEPSRALKNIQHSVLSHDDAQLWSNSLVGAPASGADPPVNLTARPESPGAPSRSTSFTERRTVSVVLLKADWDRAGADHEKIDNALHDMDSLIRSEVDWYDGNVKARVGSLWLVLFSAPDSRRDDAHRAVLAAFGIRHLFGKAAGEQQGRSIRIAVATGEALVRLSSDSDHSVSVAGNALEECHSLLADVPPMQIWVADRTHRQTSGKITYLQRAIKGIWAAVGIGTAQPDHRQPAMIGRHRELAELARLLQPSSYWDPPHVVRITGDAGIGKSRLIDEVERGITTSWPGVNALVVRAPTAIDSTARELMATGLALCCGITTWDESKSAELKFRHTLTQSVDDAQERGWLFAHLLPLVAGTEADSSPPSAEIDAMLGLWWRFIDLVSARRRTVVIVDDIDRAHRALVEKVIRLADPDSTSPLFMITAGPPDPINEQSRWGDESPRMTRLHLRPLPDEQMARIVKNLLTEHSVLPDVPIAGTDPIGTVVGISCGNPMFAVEYSQRLSENLRNGPNSWLVSIDAAALAAPEPIHRAVSTQLDALPAAVRTVAQYAAVVGDSVWTGAVAAAGELGLSETAQSLETLAGLGFLVKNTTGVLSAETTYTFQHTLVRHIAYSQVPRSLRAELHRRVVAWLDRQHAESLSAHHRAQIQQLALATEFSVREIKRRTFERVERITGQPIERVADLVRHHLILATTATPDPLELSILIRDLRGGLSAATALHPRPEFRRDFGSNAQPAGSMSGPTASGNC